MHRIIHISDIHIGTHVPEFVEMTIESINEYNPDLMIFTGDMTQDGQVTEYEMAAEYMERIDCQKFMVPGNHDHHYTGNILYRKYFGKPGEISLSLDDCDLELSGYNTALPDLNDGRLSDRNFHRLKENLERADKTCLLGVALHHHLVPPPISGAPKSLLFNAGDVLEALLQYDGNIVFCGHRHVPNSVAVEDLQVLNAGTPTKKKLRGWVPRNFTVIDIDEGKYDIHLHIVEKNKKMFFTSFQGVTEKNEEIGERYVLRRRKRNPLTKLFPMP